MSARSTARAPRVAIIDYGMGNLYSVQLACESQGIDAAITSSADDVRKAEGIILPGVGAFAHAMSELDRLGLSDAVRETVKAGKPVFGICLGLQLLMTESTEFGLHRGLGVIDGQVVKFDHPRGAFGPLKIPQVGWEQADSTSAERWNASLLAGVPDGAFMYFVHSYHVVVANPDLVVATSQYGQIRYASAVSQDNVFACQFHPERSGPLGLRVYRNFYDRLLRQQE